MKVAPVRVTSRSARTLGIHLLLVVASFIAGASACWIWQHAQASPATLPGAAKALSIFPASDVASKVPTANGAATQPVTTAAVTGQNDPTSLEKVAEVNGKVITLRDIEDSLLKKEGVEEVEKKLNSLLSITDWSRLKDDDLIVATKFGKVCRRDLAIDLVAQKGNEVREDLIELEELNQAMNDAGLVFDQAAIDAEIARDEKRLQQELSKSKQVTDLRTIIMQKENMTLEAYERTPVFRMLTGMHMLVQRRAAKEISQTDLQAFFEEHRNEYEVHEGVDLSDIYLPYQSARKEASGEHISADEKEVRSRNAVNIYNAIRKGTMSFDKMYRFLDASSDPDATGHIGWVQRSGEQTQLHSRILPPEVMDMAFAAQKPFPNMLPPIEHDKGIDIIIVHGRRDAQKPIFALIKEKVLTDYVDSKIDELTKKMRGTLRREAAPPVYYSLGPLIEARRAAAVGNVANH